MIARLLVLFINFVIVDSVRSSSFTVAVPGSALLEIITSNHSNDANQTGQDLTEKSSSIRMNAHKGKKPTVKKVIGRFANVLAKKKTCVAAKEKTDPWLEIKSVKSLGLCMGRTIVRVTWSCKGNKLPWQCRQPDIEKSSLYYASSGRNSGSDMVLTWTPFKQIIGNSFGAFIKMPWETCWEHWRDISEVLHRERRNFVRFGTTNVNEMPKFTPVELIAVSYMLGGGVWEKGIGTEVAESLCFGESLPAPPLMWQRYYEILTEGGCEALTGGDVEDVGQKKGGRPPLKRAEPQFNTSENCREEVDS